MASISSHARSHSLLLLQRILNLRDAASPLTLVLDTLEQTARPLLRELYTRAKVRWARRTTAERCVMGSEANARLAQLSKTKVILVSFTTVKKPRGVDVLVKASGRDLKAVRQELMAHYPALNAGEGRPKPAESEPSTTRTASTTYESSHTPQEPSSSSTL